MRAAAAAAARGGARARGGGGGGARTRRRAARAARLTLAPTGGGGGGGGGELSFDVPEVASGGAAVGSTADALVVLGSGADADVQLPADEGVEARHATIACRGGKFFLTDAESSAGTYMQGAKLMPGVSYLLGNGNKLSFGPQATEFEARFEDAPAQPSMEETLMRQMVEAKLKEAEDNIRRNGGDA